MRHHVRQADHGAFESSPAILLSSVLVRVTPRASASAPPALAARKWNASGSSSLGRLRSSFSVELPAPPTQVRLSVQRLPSDASSSPLALPPRLASSSSPRRLRRPFTSSMHILLLLNLRLRSSVSSKRNASTRPSPSPAHDDDNIVAGNSLND